LTQENAKFADSENVIFMANGWLEDHEQQFVYDGICALKKHWNKYIFAGSVKHDKI